MGLTIRSHQVGITLGGLLGAFHLLWALSVAVGIAQPILNIVFRMHMIQPVFTVLPFSVGMTVALIIFTSVCGYVIGFASSYAWGIVQKEFYRLME